MEQVNSKVSQTSVRVHQSSVDDMDKVRMIQGKLRRSAADIVGEAMKVYVVHVKAEAKEAKARKRKGASRG